ncbi:MAG: hypothetical protein KW793_00940 [Candidatus Doudnabacteria bacterium]|nr:hypothetical protein [Candidatus Doudnabacteria bacterium]
MTSGIGPNGSPANRLKEQAVRYFNKTTRLELEKYRAEIKEKFEKLYEADSDNLKNIQLIRSTLEPFVHLSNENNPHKLSEVELQSHLDGFIQELYREGWEGLNPGDAPPFKPRRPGLLSRLTSRATIRSPRTPRESVTPRSSDLWDGILLMGVLAIAVALVIWGWMQMPDAEKVETTSSPVVTTPVVTSEPTPTAPAAPQEIKVEATLPGNLVTKEDLKNAVEDLRKGIVGDLKTEISLTRKVVYVEKKPARTRPAGLTITVVQRSQVGVKPYKTVRYFK